MARGVKRALTRERKLTIEEYEAKAMLLDMNYSDLTSSFFGEGIADKFLDADTLEPMTPKEWIERYRVALAKGESDET